MHQTVAENSLDEAVGNWTR